MQAAIYFPTLHSKRGEITAIGHLSPTALTRIRPTINIVKPKSDNNDPIEHHLSDLAMALVRSWGTRLPLFFDFPRYGPEEQGSDGCHPVEYFFDCAKQLRMQAVPVAGPESIRGPGYRYLEAVARIAHRDQSGVAVRIPYRELSKPDALEGVIDDTLKILSVIPDMVDLFLDFEALTHLPPEARSEESVLAVTTDALRAIGDKGFRNLVLCGSSIPERVGKEYNWNLLRVSRTELKAWQKLLSRKSNPLVGFGDNGVTFLYDQDPGGSGPPPNRIRLSAGTEHIFWRAPRGNYRKLCSRATNGEDFDAKLPAWGAEEIYGCGLGRGNEGNATDWVARDTNLHLESTARFVETTLSQHGRLTGLIFAKPENFHWLQSSLDISQTS